MWKNQNKWDRIRSDKLMGREDQVRTYDNRWDYMQ